MLTAGQRAAATAILANRDFLSVLIGDAGTGKTTVLTAIEGAHLAAGGRQFVPLAPTTRAREAITDSGFVGADTIQRFLISEVMQAQAAGRVILVDEAGMLSTQQLDHLTKIAVGVRARVLLVGDPRAVRCRHRGPRRDRPAKAAAPQAAITNVISEGFNSKIQAIKADARGFRRFENYRYRILFHCGKLDLLPVIP